MSITLPPESLARPLSAFIEEVCEAIEDVDWVQDDDGLFQLIRCLKAHPTLVGTDASKAHRAVILALRSSPRRSNCAGVDLAQEDGEVAFHRMWDRVRFPMGSDPVEAACELAKGGVLRTQKERPGRYSLFLTVAALLQIQRRQQPIMLPVRKLASQMKCQANTVSAWTAWAQEDRVLLRVQEHAFRSTGGSRAAEYVFALHKWRGEGLERLSRLIGISVADRDLSWIAGQFDDA